MLSRFKTDDVENLVIIGSGPAGLTCAIYAARSDLKPIVITGNAPGGQLMQTDVIQNYPGIESITGPDLMMNMMQHAEKLGAKLVYDNVVSLKKEDATFNIVLESGVAIQAKVVVYAAGASHRKLGVPGEAEFSAKGVSWCATCDGAYYKNKVVAVVGGGNTALMEALFLSNLASQVFLIHRGEKFRADLAMQEKTSEKSNIIPIMNSRVIEICGNTSVEYVLLDNVDKPRLDITGLFIAIGASPSSSLLNGIVDMDESGYIKTNGAATTCDGLFAVGDVVSGSLRQAIYAAGTGALAAVEVEAYLGIR